MLSFFTSVKNVFLHKLKKANKQANKNLTFCQKVCPPKMLSAENFIRRNILSTEIQSMSNQYKTYFKTYFYCKVNGEIRSQFKTFVGQNCRNLKFVPEAICPPKFCHTRYVLNFWPSYIFI